MEKIPNIEVGPADSEAPLVEVRAENSHERGADVPSPTPENALAKEQADAIRQDIFKTDAKKEGGPAVSQIPPTPPEAPAGGGGVFWKKMGKFIKGGFTLLGGLFLLGVSQGIAGIASLPEKLSKWTGKGGGGGGHGGGGSHAKATPKHAAPSGGHGSSGHKGGGGGHGHH
jgi:hypothetical protein